MGRQVFPLGASNEASRAFLGGKPVVSLADEVDRTVQCVAVDHDFNRVAVAHPPDRTAAQGLWRDVADAGAGRDSTEACVRKNDRMFAEWQALQRRSDLVNLLHARS